EVFVVAYVHPFLDGPGHTGKSHAELRVQLFSHCSYAAVAQVIDVVDEGLRVDETDKVLYDKDNVFLGEYPLVVTQVEAEFLVDPVAAYFTQVVTLFAEEKTLDDIASRLLVGRFCIP